MQKKQIIIILIILYYKLLIAYSQKGEYSFLHLDINNGLSHNQVNCFYQDKQGFLWIGTMSGLNRFDGYNFKIFRHNVNDTNSLKDNFIITLFDDPDGNIWINTRQDYTIYNPLKNIFYRDPNKYAKKYDLPFDANTVIKIIEDKKNRFWFISSQKGIYYYTIREKKHLKSDLKDLSTLSSDYLSDAKLTQNGNIWIINNTGTFELLNTDSLKVVYRNCEISKFYNNKILNFKIYIDSDNDLWIFAENIADGIFYFNNKSKAIEHYTINSKPIQLNTNIVRDVIEEKKGIIWIATDHGGLNVIDKENSTINYILSNPNNSRGLCHNTITTLFKDKNGIIWIGTYKKGINYYHENLIRFKIIQHKLIDPSLQKYDDVNCFAEDKNGNLWIGTNGAGLIYYDRKLNKFKYFKNEPSDKNSLSSNIIVCMYLNKNDSLWIGTFYGGLNLFDGKKFTRFTHSPDNPSSIADDRIWSIFEDSKGNLWIGTLGNGLDLFDKKTKTFKHFKSSEVNSLNSNFITCITEDKEGNLWIGTALGITLLDFNNQRHQYFSFDINNKNSLSNNNILSILCDSRGWIWIGTREGLNLYNNKTNSFVRITKLDGLPDDAILTIAEDNSGNLWMGTPNGLSNLIIKNRNIDNLKYDIHNYDESDGLQGKEFNERAVYKTKNGELIFGGPNGFNIFKPEEIKLNTTLSEVYFTEFYILNKPINPNLKINGRVILDNSILHTRHLNLKFKENIFTIEFVGLNFFQPEKNRYKYKLEGFNNEWMETGADQRRITYTNLNPGTYTFKVIASNNDGFWNEKGNELLITVKPPFWKTKFAFILYFILISLTLALLRYITLEKERINFKIEQERREAQQRHEMDMLKIKLFTNVSHEFKTPISLILSPIENLLKEIENENQRNTLLLIQRNARRLLNLVNQLLDFRRLEFQSFSLNLSFGDFVSFVRDCVNSFIDIAEKKEIRLIFNSEIQILNTYFDHDKVEKIMFNLLSNAFKFTPVKGKIEVNLNLINDIPENLKSQEDKELFKKWIKIEVKDTGIGIPKEKQQKVFERFYCDDNPRISFTDGSGIGLSLVNEFVKLHHGKISLESEYNIGSCFSIYLPYINNPVILENIEKIKDNIELTEETNSEENIIESKKPSVLLVEDNEDFLFYLKDNLKQKYFIIEAKNGKEGFDKATKYIPDLIVSDIMMPEIDGLELCKLLKTNKSTSHIPIILLTALTSEKQKINGFEYGADDYITKPFSFEILESRIKNLIQQRENVRKAFQKKFELTPSEIQVTPLDEKLIQKAINIVEQNISNPAFSVDKLAKEIGMSRVHLYKKLTALTGKTPIEFIRIIRLRRAAQLLEKSQLSVSEIAYQVGFNNPKYFSRYFKEEFNVLPSEYASDKRVKKENKNEN